ncbi:MAG: hypothetical protein D5R96_00720 [Methanocalculus sp. MSAO_Arc2]|uniref:hypothetical protein n=1 Tax=Methanocalculus sp. MSAO_Arc2 TaxID=2293855 RepID=UPI000FF1A985|nr:MAG: hypothetical protein D5R96_00720 [Methanocalculus sp. MSAO_Arc2]
MDPDEIEAIARSRLQLMNPATRKTIRQAGELSGLNENPMVRDPGCGNGIFPRLAERKNAVGKIVIGNRYFQSDRSCRSVPSSELKF